MVGREEGGERQDNAYFPISGKREGGEEAKCDLLRPGIIYELLLFFPAHFFVWDRGEGEARAVQTHF